MPEPVSDETKQHFNRAIAGALNRPDLKIVDLSLLGGGAIQENWIVHFTTDQVGGPREEALVLRTDATSGVAVSHSREIEFHLLVAADRAGVTVPRPLAFVDQDNPLGRPFFLMEAAEGTALGQKVVRSPFYQNARSGLAFQLGQELARIHTMEVSGLLKTALGETPISPAAALISSYREHLESVGRLSPIIEFALRWLHLHAPEAKEVVLVHRDFRTGNYMIDQNGLTAILDWEFAGWGDPMEDIGWFCSGDWRFGCDQLEAGGIGQRREFYDGYCSESGRTIDPAVITYWEVMAATRWAIIALQQADRLLSGEERRLELALIGRRVHFSERILLNLIKFDKRIS